ncbi:MAG: hypothetical protein K8W52_05785 [Deltaproteobacteria bacterium]|nr:hypothetical protein [Deltaproteobacteria bacterium]
MSGTHAALDELFATLRRLPPRMGVFWDVAYARAQLAALGPDSMLATWHQERGFRLLLALALIVPEPTLRAQFDRVIEPDAQLADLIALIRPLVVARDVAGGEHLSMRALARAMLEVLGEAPATARPAPHAPAPPARARADHRRRDRVARRRGAAGTRR